MNIKELKITQNAEAADQVLRRAFTLISDQGLNITGYKVSTWSDFLCHQIDFTINGDERKFESSVCFREAKTDADS